MTQQIQKNTQNALKEEIALWISRPVPQNEIVIYVRAAH